MSAMEVNRASVIRSDWFRTAHALFQSFDVLALPSAQVWPFDVDLVHPTEIAGVQMDTYHRWMECMVPASLTGLPALSVPVGFGPEGLPAGMQLIGSKGSDDRLIALATAWHEASDWQKHTPPL